MSFVPEQSGVEMEKDLRSVLRVHCLGTFQVIRPGESTAMAVGSRQKAWALFKYLVTNRGTAIPTETIMDLFWPDRPDREDTAPLRTAISRLNSQLEPRRSRYEKPTYLFYRRDACAFNADAPVWVDTEEFERMCRTAQAAATTDRTHGAALYDQALHLYRGDFLAEDLYSDWTLLAREHYRRLFLDSTKEAATWLLQVGDFERARSLLERTVELDPFLEELHTLLMRVLVEAGDYKAAMAHYTHSTSLLYNELGVSPSEELRRFYRQAKGEQSGSSGPRRRPAHIAKIEKLLGSRGEAQGALICGAEVFHEMLLLERRRLLRRGGESSLIFLEAARADSGRSDHSALDLLQPLAHGRLRKGDVICRPDEHHLVLLCTATSEAGAQIVVGRIRDAFRKNHPTHRTTIRSSIRALTPLRDDG